MESTPHTWESVSPEEIMKAKFLFTNVVTLDHSVTVPSIKSYNIILLQTNALLYNWVAA